MLRYTQNDAGSDELQEALDTMLSVLKYVNDIMHQIGITGFNVSTCRPPSYQSYLRGNVKFCNGVIIFGLDRYDGSEWGGLSSS